MATKALSFFRTSRSLRARLRLRNIRTSGARWRASRGVRRRPRGERALPGVGRDATAVRVPRLRRRAPTERRRYHGTLPRRRARPGVSRHRRVARVDGASVRRGVRREVPLELEAATTRRARALVVQPRGAHRGETNVAARAASGPGGEPERTSLRRSRRPRGSRCEKRKRQGPRFFRRQKSVRRVFAAKRARRDATDAERVRGRLRRGRHRDARVRVLP